MSTHPATRIAELERELAGARFAAQQHLQTVEAQAAIIARYSQPILSAGVAIKTWQERTGNHNIRPGSVKHMMAEIADLRAALASAPAQPVAATPEATGGLPPLPEPICVKPASGPLFSDGQMTAFALDALARLPAIPEAGQSVPEALFDGYAVLKALKPREAAFVSPEAVSAVLDAAVRLIRATPSPAVQAGTAQGSE